jgi:DNA invertase Pin-like site-specific DNA recombinase
MKIAIYIKNDSAETVDCQRIELLQFLATKPDWDLKNIYVDSKDTRPKFKQLVSNLKKDKIELIVCYSLMDLARSITSVVKLVSGLSEKGIYIASFKENISSESPESMAVFQALEKTDRKLFSQKVALAINKTRQSPFAKIGRPKKSCDHQELLKLHKAGYSYGYIGKALGISKSSAFQKLKSISQI